MLFTQLVDEFHAIPNVDLEPVVLQEGELLGGHTLDRWVQLYYVQVNLKTMSKLV